jgi:glycosyltransferase involved in cell wall biosynthesis
MKNFLISIITASSNDIRNLKKTYKSLKKLDYINFEWIIVDNASSDGTFLWANQLKQKFNIHCISEIDNGIYDAWNKALDISKGEWITFVGAGDFLDSSWFSNASSYFDKGFNLIYGDIDILSVDGSRKIGVFKGKPWSDINLSIKIRMNLPHSGCLHRKDLFENQKFNQTFKIAGDWHFYLTNNRIFAHYLKNTLMCSFPLGGISSSSRGLQLSYYEYVHLIKLGVVIFDIRESIKWKIKLLLSKKLKYYLYFQEKMWKFFT